MAIARSISDIISQGLVTDLTNAFLSANPTEVPAVVRIGRLQENPVRDRIYLLVHPGDPDFPEQWKDNIVAKNDENLDKFSFQIPAFEVGGGVMRWRRHTIQVGFYGISEKESRDDAQAIYKAVMARVDQAVWQSTTALGQTDDFRETAIKTFSAESSDYESGGKNSFIWRGRVHVMTLTGQVLVFA